MPYPDYLGATEVHVALFTFPEEGAEMRVGIDVRLAPDVLQNVTIPAGSAPFVFNVSCRDCYAINGRYVVFAMYMEPQAPVALLQQESITITSFRVEDAYAESDPAAVNASFLGLTAGQNYTVSLWCHDPPMASTVGLSAESYSATFIFKARPGRCASARLLTIASSDGVYTGVAST